MATLSILDVGHGNCAVLLDSERVTVIDAGLKNGLLQYLVAAKRKKIDVVLISHADADHFGGLIGLLSSGAFSFSEIRVNTDSQKKSACWDDILWELKEQEKVGKFKFHTSLTTSDSGSFDYNDLQIEILGPSGYLAGKGPGTKDKKKRKITTNSISAVIRIVRKGAPVALFTGDLDGVGLAHLIEDRVNATAPLVVFPHHGGKPGNAEIKSFTKSLYELTKPATVIFSFGRGHHKNPRPEIVDVLKGLNKKIRIICTQLSEHCAPDLPPEIPIYLNAVFAGGRECRKCCAGTIVVPLDDDAELLPRFQDHQEFIKSYAPTALCQ